MRPAAGLLLLAVASLPLAAQTSPAVYGGVPQGTATGEVITLTLQQAVSLGLQRNLAITTGEDDVRLARARRLVALNALIPNVYGRVAETVQQINLETFGLPPFPGVAPIVGPFGVSDARAATSINVFNLPTIRNWQAARTIETAARLNYEDLRDQVVTAVVQLYIQSLTLSAQGDNIRAQLATAEALFKQASDQKAAGVAIGIDVLRSQVEVQNQRQRLILNGALEEKSKLNLARAIGLPSGQRIKLEMFDDSGATAPPIDDYLRVAVSHRSDIKAAQAQIQAAERNRSAAGALWLPTVSVDANYGATGRRPDDAHGTFAVTGGVNFPIFPGTRIKAAKEEADAELSNRRAVYADLQARIDNEVRSAYFDLQAAQERLTVARENSRLAAETLEQARDRFAAGVTNNLEVVQAQQTVASANEAVISSRYGLEIARLSLARAAGNAEQMVKESTKETK
jgi:outer membrane protein TolC